jgi:hypothetical protein
VTVAPAAFKSPGGTEVAGDIRFAGSKKFGGTPNVVKDPVTDEPARTLAGKGQHTARIAVATIRRREKGSI